MPSHAQSSLGQFADVNLAALIDAGNEIGPTIHPTAPYLDVPANPLPQIENIVSTEDAQETVWSLV